MLAGYFRSKTIKNDQKLCENVTFISGTGF